MGILEGAIISSPDIIANFAGISAPLVTKNITKAVSLQSSMWGYKARCKSLVQIGRKYLQPCSEKHWRIHCSFSSSSDGDGRMAGNFNANDEEYVNSTVIEAVQVRSGSDGFMIKMRDGKFLRCIHNNPQEWNLPDYAPQPAIVLKMEDGSGLLLPIIVLEMPSVLLMAAVRNVQIARPTIYQVLMEMIERMGYVVQLVRVTKRVNEAYFAQLYLCKVGNETETISFDLRPSDAINMAVRCKVPIQVNKNLAYSDGMKVVEPSKLTTLAPLSDGMLFAELDSPDGEHCLDSEEFSLIQKMMNAAVEERYSDAAQWRDQLNQLRSERKNWT